MAGTEVSKAGIGAAIGFEGVTPIFRVRSVSASIEYYVDVLRYKLDWQVGGFASVSCGRCQIFLSEGDQGHPGAWVWIGVEDADALFAEYRTKGAKVRHPPTNYSWAYEMQVEDLDGNILRLGSDPKSDQAIGEWLDMRGDRWALSPAGEWVRVDRV
jgi:catechol 2,3-dioxygenase-like lactoylglutathione lyase family enzyme